MPTRKAHARWEGSLKEGKGQVDFGNGAFKGRTRSPRVLKAVRAPSPKSCWARPMRAASRWRCR